MIPKGTLLSDATDCQSSNYEKSSARRKQRLDISCLLRLRCKPTVGESPVGVSRAAVFGRRVLSCDTTMYDIRRHDRRGSIKNPRNVHNVHPGRSRVDAKNRNTAGWFSIYVQASTPKCNVHTEVTRKAKSNGLSKSKKDVDWGGRLDAAHSHPSPCGDYLRPPYPAAGGRGGRVSGEVTL